MNSERIESLVQKVQSLPDSSARDAALELVQAVMELHGNGLERILEIISETDGGAALIDQIGADPLAGSMLLLHDLHPLDMDTRVRRALDRPEFRARGAKVDLISVRDGVIRIHVSGGSALKSAVEQAVFEAAPDASMVSVDGGGSESFVPLAQLWAG